MLEKNMILYTFKGYEDHVSKDTFDSPWDAVACYAQFVEDTECGSIVVLCLADGKKVEYCGIDSQKNELIFTIGGEPYNVQRIK